MTAPDDRIIPSWEDAADRWMNAYLATKAERDELVDAAREVYLAWLIGTAHEYDRAWETFTHVLVNLPGHDEWLESRKGTPIAPRQA